MPAVDEKRIALKLAEDGHSPALSEGLSKLPDLELVGRGAFFVAEFGDRIVQDLETAGWWVGQPLLERMLSSRLDIQPPAAAVSR